MTRINSNDTNSRLAGLFSLNGLRLGLAAVAATALVTGAAFARAQNDGQKQGRSGVSASGKLSIVSSESLDADDGDGQVRTKSETFEIRLEDGKISVRRNGKDVPDAQIVQKDGRVVILDENGNELKAIKVFTDGPGGFFYRKGEDGGFMTGAGALRGFTFTGDSSEDGAAPKVMLGVHMGQPDPALEKHLGLETGTCTMITGVLEGLPAHDAGIGEYDIIVAVDGKKPADAASIRKALEDKQAGDTVTLRIIHEGREKDVKVTLEAYDAEKMSKAKLLGKAADPFGSMMPLGGDFDQLQNQLKEWQLQLPKGLEGRVFVAPQIKEWQGLVDVYPKIEEWREDLQPLIEKHLRDALEKHGVGQGTDDGADKDKREADADSEKIEEQLDRLDRRLTDLERLLEKLVEKQAKP